MTKIIGIIRADSDFACEIVIDMATGKVYSARI
jgi:hypothetical protein